MGRSSGVWPCELPNHHHFSCERAVFGGQVQAGVGVTPKTRLKEISANYDRHPRRVARQVCAA